MSDAAEDAHGGQLQDDGAAHGGPDVRRALGEVAEFVVEGEAEGFIEHGVETVGQFVGTGQFEARQQRLDLHVVFFADHYAEALVGGRQEGPALLHADEFRAHEVPLREGDGGIPGERVHAGHDELLGQLPEDDLGDFIGDLIFSFGGEAIREDVVPQVPRQGDFRADRDVVLVAGEHVPFGHFVSPRSSRIRSRRTAAFSYSSASTAALRSSSRRRSSARRSIRSSRVALVLPTWVALPWMRESEGFRRS